MFEVDNYLAKRFSLRSYNCWHFAAEVWKELTGETLRDFTPEQTHKHALRLAACDAATEFIEVTGWQGWRPMVEPLLVLMLRAHVAPHIGVLHQMKVLHLRQSGPMYQDLDTATGMWPTVRFYKTASRS